jgi:peptidyl-prolyl cis-trans isomerase C
MVAPFSEAVVKLEKGKYTETPVQTQFGWHVILREDSRAQTPPPLASVKEQLMPFLQRKKVQNMVETLRKQAKVEILVPLTDEKPKAPVNDKAATEQPVAEEVVVEEEVKNAAGKTVVEEVVEEKAPAEASKTAEKTVEKKATHKVKETTKAAKKAAKSEPNK